MSSEKYCRDCEFYDVPDDARPCVECDDNKIMFEPRRDGVAAVYSDCISDWSDEDKRKLRDEIVAVPPKAPKASKAYTIYRNISTELLKRVRDVLERYLYTSTDEISTSARNRIKHDIDLLTQEINDAEERRFKQLQLTLVYVLDCACQIQTSSDGQAMPRISDDELSDLMQWATTEAFK